MAKKTKVLLISGLLLVLMLSSVFIYRKMKFMWKLFNEKMDYATLMMKYENSRWEDNVVKISFDGQELSLDTASQGMSLEFSSLNTEGEVPVTFTCSDIYEITMDGIPAISGETFLYQVKKIAPDYYIPITLYNTITYESKNFSIRTFPSALPTYTVVRGENSPLPGFYYVTPFMSVGGAVYKLDINGNTVFYKYSPYTPYWDFKQADTPDGIRYIYCQQVPSQHTPKAYTASVEYVILDEDYHELKRLRMEKSEKIPDDNWPADQHDMLYISDSEYYLLAYVNKNVTNIPENVPHKESGTLVAASLIQGFRDGKLFFEWDSSDYPELYEESYEYNDFTNNSNEPADYAHINSIDLDRRDGNIIVSFRNLNSVFKLDTNTGSILWKLSGTDDSFGLTPDQKTSRQHYARYNDNGSITIFDNGNENRQTRITEYWLDEDNKSLKDFSSYQIDNYYSWATGSTQRLSDEVDVFMVGWGMKGEGAPYYQPNFSEIDFTNNKILFEFCFDDASINTYRCVKY